MGREMSWEIEVGEVAEASSTEVVAGMYASKSTPTVSRLDSETAFVFKITNLPGPESNYFLTVENDELLLKHRTRSTSSVWLFKTYAVPSCLTWPISPS